MIVIKSQGKRAKKNKETKKNHKNNPKPANKMAISTYLSITTLNVSGLNASIRTQSGWIDKKPKTKQDVAYIYIYIYMYVCVGVCIYMCYL